MIEGSAFDNGAAQAGDLGRYLAMARRWWWMLVAGGAAAGVAAFLVTNTIAPTYQASATLLVNQVQQPGSIAYSDILTSERLTKTYAEMIKTQPVLTAAAEIDGSLTPEELKSKLSTSVVRDTQLVRITVKDQQPARAARLADSVADAFLENESARAMSRPGTTSIVEPAKVPDTRVSPNLEINVALAVIAGLVLAAGLAALLEYLDDTVKTAKDVKAASSLPTLAEIGRFRIGGGDQGSVNDQNYESEREAYGVLRANIQFSTIGQNARVILVTSADSGEGKSTTSAHYGMALAETGKRVAVIDSDLRRPSLHKIFGLDNSVGLTTALLDSAALDGDVLLATPQENLFVMTSGPLPPNPAELLDWSGFDALIERLKEQVDIVILNSPPVLAVADARIMAAKADATVLVAWSSRTRAKGLKDAFEALLKAKANIVGVALNRVSRSRSYRYHYYYYSYGSGRNKMRKSRSLVPVLAKVQSEAGSMGGIGGTAVGAGASGSPTSD